MKIQYAGWTDAAPLNLSLKDALKLAKQLKTYVNSTKFIQDGSKINKVNKDGVLTKAPVKDVVYYQDALGSNPMTALQLDDFIRTAIINKDPLMLQLASLYRFYASKPVVTLKLRIEQLIKDYRKRLSRNAFIWSTLLGIGGASLPIALRLVSKKKVTGKAVKSATLLALAGFGGGFAMANLTTKR